MSYTFAEVLMNGERIIVDLAIFKMSENSVDCFRSIFLSSGELDFHVGQYGSLEGYNGSYTVDWLPVCFKHEDVEIALMEARRFLCYLDASYEILPSTLRIAYSGTNGFDILLPSELFGYVEPSVHVPKIFRNLILEITEGFKGIDTEIYNHRGLIRFTNSIASTTGLYKTPMSFHEIFNRSVEEIQQMATKPRTPKDLVPRYDVRINHDLQNLYWLYKNLSLPRT